MARAIINYLEEVKDPEKDHPKLQLPQLTVNILKDNIMRGFMRKLAEGEELNNWKVQDATTIFKK